MRESQALGLSLPKTGMAVAIDLGEPSNIHPGNKQDVGYRLALTARAVAQGEAWCTAVRFTYPPILRMAQSCWNSATSGAALPASTGGRNCAASPSPERMEGFSGEAEIIGSNQVRVYSDEVPNPLYVRYAWADNPGELDLYNAEGLPAAPFRTDTLRVPWQH
ncbi:MAG: hypothetical protein H6573_00720 [Lewinellaceae bacterium]|nr:hypothetical protein [Lewinellaceae bacterium]